MTDQPIILKGGGVADCEIHFNGTTGDILLKQPGGPQPDGIDRVMLNKVQVDQLIVEIISHRCKMRGATS